MNIFEQAAIKQIRFTTSIGLVSTEQLFTLPLQSKSGANLDAIAKHVNSQLRSVTEESFVNTTENPAKAEYELMLEIVKHVIATKLEAAAKAKQSRDRAAERDTLLAVLDQKKNAALADMSVEQLTARLKEIA